MQVLITHKCGHRLQHIITQALDSEELEDKILYLSQFVCFYCWRKEKIKSKKSLQELKA